MSLLYIDDARVAVASGVASRAARLFRGRIAKEYCSLDSDEVTMVTYSEHLSLADQCEIDRLIVAAGEYGAADVYQGKRRSRRVSNAIRLEVTTDPSDPVELRSVMLHNIAESGLAFWSKKRFLHGERVFIREFSKAEPRPWVVAHIMHRTFGIRGFLVGVEFDLVRVRIGRRL